MSAATAPETTPGVEVVLDGLTRRFGEVLALDGLDLRIAPGEMVALLGPSGCGKTTALRILAGLDRADAGQVRVGGKELTTVPANKRDMGMVFQAYSLFPHMTVAENVSFGLKMRGVAPKQRRARAAEMLELVGLDTHGNRYAHQLSGGQQQRVALARALAIEPSVLLLDEPLSALDAKVRTQLREEIRRVQVEVGTTTVFVTHDQEEALAIADRVGVMSHGRLEQIAAPEELYTRPLTRFVAEFVGLTNRLPATSDGSATDLLGSRVPLLAGSITTGSGVALVRPEALSVATSHDGNATVVTRSFLGSLCRVTCRLDEGTELVAQTSTEESTDLRPGARVRVRVSPSPVLVVDTETVRQPRDVEPAT